MNKLFCSVLSVLALAFFGITAAVAEHVTVINQDGTTTVHDLTIVSSAALVEEEAPQLRYAEAMPLRQPAPTICTSSIEAVQVGFDYVETWLVTNCRDYESGYEYSYKNTIGRGKVVWLRQSPFFVDVTNPDGNYIASCTPALAYWIVGSSISNAGITRMLNCSGGRG